MPDMYEVANKCSLTRERKDSSWDYRESKHRSGERLMNLGWKGEVLKIRWKPWGCAFQAATETVVEME